MFLRLERSWFFHIRTRARERVAAMRHRADHRLGDRQRTSRGAGEVDVVVHVSAREHAHARRGERLEARQRARGDFELGRLRQRDAAAVGQHDGTGRSRPR